MPSVWACPPHTHEPWPNAAVGLECRSPDPLLPIRLQEAEPSCLHHILTHPCPSSLLPHREALGTESLNPLGCTNCSEHPRMSIPASPFSSFPSPLALLPQPAPALLVPPAHQPCLLALSSLIWPVCSEIRALPATAVAAKFHDWVPCP